MFLLSSIVYHEDGQAVDPIILSDSKEKLEKYSEKLMEDSIKYNCAVLDHDDACHKIVKDYLSDNRAAFTDWRDVRSQVKTNYPPTKEDQDKVINYFSNGCWSLHGKNIVEVGTIPKYFDINKLSKPYPKLPEPPRVPNPYYIESSLEIREVDVL